MAKVTYYTKEGFKKLKDELEHLMNVQRPLISNQIAEARDKGDLSENAEYDAAKDAQGMLEMKIAKLQELISNARILDESKMDESKVLLLSTVRLKNHKTGKEMAYTIVPENEADLKLNKVSVNSPIAKGLLGKKVGERAKISAPAGIIELEILEITR
ncbi:MAG TPA: transcription elongation factor GreA [Bacteroidales bacterium]|nr:transcription elongation factor GreA [Bacteroidales bacterium]HRZ48786.1 transcription elongation factor GreA [Bacteroidales bacterium]